MRASMVLLLLASVALGACSERTKALRSDEDVQIASLDRKCAAIATTGDMYRDCLEVGPDKLAFHN